MILKCYRFFLFYTVNHFVTFIVEKHIFNVQHVFLIIFTQN